MDHECCCSRSRLLLFSRRISPHPLITNFKESGAALSKSGSFCAYAFLLLLLLGNDAIAQVTGGDSRKLLHGSILTTQGQPAAQVNVEIRDLRGIKVGSSITDGAGNFEITGKADPGEYILLAVGTSEVRDQRIRLDQPELEASLALPASAAKPGPTGYTVSAKRLGVPAKTWTHLAAADRAFKKIDFEGAAREVEAALLTDPTCARAFSMRAFIELAEKNPRGAVEDAEYAVQLGSDDAESFVALAMSYNALKDFPKAEDAAERALRLRPDSWQGRLELAESYYGKGEFIRALCELDSANIDFPDAHLVRGNALISLDRPQEALDEFTVFLQEAPNDPRVGQIRRIEAKLRPARGAPSTSAR